MHTVSVNRHGRFVSYGKKVTSPAGKPTSESELYRYWSDLAHYHIDGETEIGLCTVARLPRIVIDGMERHLKTPEILIPIDKPFILPVHSGDDRDEPEAFQFEPGEAVLINPGVWHAASLPVNGDSCTYFVIFRRNTPHEDVEKKSVKPFGIAQDRG